MQMLSITELMRLTRHELCVLLTRTETCPIIRKAPRSAAPC